MALADLVTQGYSGSPMTDEARIQLQKMLMDRARAEIERTSGNQARDINERTFGRGLGLSTVSAQLQAENNRLREETLIKANTDAEVAARQAQMAALGQAASYALGERARALAERGQATQESQFGRTQAQQANLSRQNLVGGGLGALAGAGLQTAGNIWGKNIKEQLADLFAKGGPTGGPGGTADVLRPEGLSPSDLQVPGYSEMPVTQLPEINWPTDLGASNFGGMEDFGALPSSPTDFTFPDWTEGLTGLEGLIQPDWNWDNWGL